MVQALWMPDADNLDSVADAYAGAPICLLPSALRRCLGLAGLLMQQAAAQTRWPRQPTLGVANGAQLALRASHPVCARGLLGPQESGWRWSAAG